MLTSQYRMNAAIMDYSNRKFYEGKLVAAPGVADHLIFPGDKPLLFIDTAGCGYEEKQVGTSTSNPEEAAFLVNYLRHYQNECTLAAASTENLSIGIIAPYKEQLEAIRQAIHEEGSFPFKGQLSVNTVDSFQGQERDIILISMTRSNPDSRIGFLSEIRRMNVAMTRARKKLVIIGDSSTLAQHAFYAGLIEMAEKHNAYQSAWEYL